MVLRSCPRCRVIAEIVQPRRCNACASTSSSRVIMRGGGPFGLPVVRDQQLRRDLRRLGGATRVGKFSEQGRAREGGLQLAGEGGLLAQLTKRLVESAL